MHFVLHFSCILVSMIHILTLISIIHRSCLTLSQTTNFRFLQTESLQTILSNLMEMVESSPKMVENTVEKEEIAHYKPFLLFVRHFLNSCTTDVHRFVLESVNPLPDDKILDWSKLKEIADNILKCI